jgi:hypothetical protein
LWLLYSEAVTRGNSHTAIAVVLLYVRTFTSAHLVPYLNNWLQITWTILSVARQSNAREMAICNKGETLMLNPYWHEVIFEGPLSAHARSKTSHW